MKKLMGFSKRIVFGLLLSLFCLYGLAAQQFSEFTFTVNTNPLSLSLPMLTAGNLSNPYSIMERQLLPYTMILSQQELNYNPLLDEPLNSNSETSEFENMLNLQMQNLLELETQWQALETHYRLLSTYSSELLRLLEESKHTIAQLRQNLECALERVQDAEEGAIALLDENAEIFRQARLAVANIANLQRELTKSRRGVIIGWVVGGVSFGVGTPLIIEGIRSDNKAMLWSGVGVVVIPNAVWALGRFAFKWW